MSFEAELLNDMGREKIVADTEVGRFWGFLPCGVNQALPQLVFKTLAASSIGVIPVTFFLDRASQLTFPRRRHNAGL